MPGTTVGEMTKEELKAFISSIIEAKLLELFGDPDEGLSLRGALLHRLEEQHRAVRGGERGEDFDAVTKRLGLA